MSVGDTAILQFRLTCNVEIEAIYFRRLASVLSGISSFFIKN